MYFLANSNGLPDEMDRWEKTKMWPFSCVSVEKDLPSLPGNSIPLYNTFSQMHYIIKTKKISPFLIIFF